MKNSICLSREDLIALCITTCIVMMEPRPTSIGAFLSNTSAIFGTIRALVALALKAL